MNDFEAACNEVDTDFNGNSMQENVIEWIGNSIATVNFVKNSRFASKVRELAEKFPDDVQIVTDKDALVAHIPVKYIHLGNYSRPMTDEQREAAAERLRSLRS